MGLDDRPEIELVDVSRLRDHPRNYVEHPDDQINHIVESISEFGIFKNIVVSRDDYILAGHGLVKALRKMGKSEVPVYRLDYDKDDPQALKVITLDNEVQHLRIKDDRALSELLRDVRNSDVTTLLGTGFDDAMLANLVFVSRHEDEVGDKNEAAEWVGMPEYDPGGEASHYRVVITCQSEEDRDNLLSTLGASRMEGKNRKTWSLRWPLRESKSDYSSIRF